MCSVVSSHVLSCLYVYQNTLYKLLYEARVRSTFASMHDTAQELRDTVRRYMKKTGVSPTRLGREAVRNPSFIAAFLNGRMPRLDTADSLLVHIVVKRGKLTPYWG